MVKQPLHTEPVGEREPPHRRPVLRWCLRLLGLLLAGASTHGLAQTAGQQVYANERFHYVLSYPADVFVPQGESVNGDGQIFLAQPGDARLIVFGQYLMDEFKGQCDAVQHAAQGVGTKVTYRLSKGHVSIASGYRGADRIFYVKTLVSGGRCLVFEIDYPVGGREKFDALVPSMAAFKNSP